MIKITHILWYKKAIGISLSKLVDGENTIQITVKNKTGKLLYPEPIVVTKQKLLTFYKVEQINKGGLQGVFMYLADIDRGVFDA
jgi:hypothetical protein